MAGTRQNPPAALEGLEPRLFLSADPLAALLEDGSPPAIVSIELAAPEIQENGLATITATFVDEDYTDRHFVTFDWGDGTTETMFFARGTREFSREHQYLDEDPTGTPADVYTITVTLTDRTYSDTASVELTVNNVAPAILELLTGAAVKGEAVTLTGSFSDAGTLDTHAAEIDWGDGTSSLADIDEDDGSGTLSGSHVYASGGLYTVMVTLVDDDGGTATAAVELAIGNADPEITELLSSAAAFGAAGEGDEVTLTGSFTDADLLDAHTAEIDWGDGTSSLAVIDEADGAGTLSGSHVYASGGIYTIVVTLSDDSDGTDTATAAAIISGAGLHDGVLQLIGTNGRDRAKVNRRGNGLLKVHANFLSAGERHRTYESEGVERIEMLLGDGNDRAHVSGNVELPAILDGGAGNDRMKAGAGPTVMLGGPGKDRLIGGRGRDILIGGEGKDRLVGGPGDDILIGGSTVFDIDYESLAAPYAEPLLDLLAEWNSDGDYATRVANLSGTAGPGLNGPYLLQDGVTVLDDGATDKLTGSSGENWTIEPLDAKALRKLLRQQQREARKAARQAERQARHQARHAHADDPLEDD